MDYRNISIIYAISFVDILEITLSEVRLESCSCRINYFCSFDIRGK